MIKERDSDPQAQLLNPVSVVTLRRAKSQEKRRNPPQNHSAAQGAHRQVDEPILVEVQLPVEAAAEILEAGSQLRGSDSLGSGKRKLGLDTVRPGWAGPPYPANTNGNPGGSLQPKALSSPGLCWPLKCLPLGCAFGLKYCV